MQQPTCNHRSFAYFYERMSRSRAFRKLYDAWRQQLVGQAAGVVLEIGAGGGQNFAFYDPAVTSRVTAIEPNDHMRKFAQQRGDTARVPIELVAARVEALPFADATFDTALATLVFCSVDNAGVALGEVARVLKPGGALLLFEHVRSPRRSWATLQDWLTPLQKRVAGNCHLNRATAATVRAAGFTIQSETWSGGGLHPQVALIAHKEDLL